MVEVFNGYELHDVGQINVILGKNGSGKSTLLRAFEGNIRRSGNGAYVRYITPERGGTLNREGNVETNISNNPNWLADVRGRNRFEQFRETSAAEFVRLETLVLRKIEKSPELRANAAYTFDTVVEEMNTLLENVELFRSPGGGFGVRNKGTTALRENQTLSSGESELISLAIEFLSFAFVAELAEHAGKDNWLLIDEPDVHLHPDLQQRLMALLARAAKGKPFKICISTHSTSIVSSLAEEGELRVAFMGRGQKSLAFEKAGSALKAVMPIFGSHPLSNVFNQMPVLLVEGEDDERIWQQAVRTSSGKISVWPCAAGAIQNLNEYELKARSVLNAVYDNAIAFSLRDRDDHPYDIDDLAPVMRARLQCRTAENLLLSDDVLQFLGVTWDNLKERLEAWMGQYPDHQSHAAVAALREAGWNRRDANVKAIRNLVVTLADSQKPWEVAVGQAIAGLKVNAPQGENSLTDFLGPKVVAALSLHP
jgi:energy-coupling factor transporter ATP-binding protein EcfA2